MNYLAFYSVRFLKTLPIICSIDKQKIQEGHKTRGTVPLLFLFIYYLIIYSYDDIVPVRFFVYLFIIYS